MRRSVGILISVLVMACAAEKPAVRDSTTTKPVARPDTTARRKILFVGTSLTAGLGLDPDSAFSYLIQRKIDSAGLPFETVNAGGSGETTAGLLERLDWLLRGEFDVIVIETGANDGLRAIDATAIRHNLDEVVKRVKAAKPAALVVLVQMEALPNYGRDYGSVFHDLYPEVAQRERVTLAPFLLAGVAGHRDLNQSDGVHPNLEGERIVAENLWRALRPLLQRRVEASRVDQRTKSP